VVGPPSTPPGAVVTAIAVLPPPDNPTLPITGSRSAPLIVLGLLALGAGVTLIVVSRARERRLTD
jgi:LPXTG-motif cell wall-anchored protein